MILTNIELLKRIANMDGGEAYNEAREIAKAAVDRYKRWEATIGFTEETRKSGIVANKSYGVAESDYFLERAGKLKEEARKKAGGKTDKEGAGHGSKFAGSSPTIGYKVYGSSQEM